MKAVGARAQRKRKSLNMKCPRFSFRTTGQMSWKTMARQVLVATVRFEAYRGKMNA